MAEKYSAAWIREQAQAIGAYWLDHHRCGGCNVMVGYTIVAGADVWFRSDCDCSSYRSEPRPSSFDEIADWLRMQDSDEVRDRLMTGLHGAAPAPVPEPSAEVVPLTARGCYLCGAQPRTTTFGPSATITEPVQCWVCPNSTFFGDDGPHQCLNAALYMSLADWNAVNADGLPNIPVYETPTLDWSQISDPGSYTIRPPLAPQSFVLQGGDRMLLKLNADGTVEGNVDDAEQAAQVFMASVIVMWEGAFDEAQKLEREAIIREMITFGQSMSITDGMVVSRVVDAIGSRRFREQGRS